MAGIPVLKQEHVADRLAWPLSSLYQGGRFPSAAAARFILSVGEVKPEGFGMSIDVALLGGVVVKKTGTSGRREDAR